MNEREVLVLISGLEKLKSVVLDSFKYRDNVSSLPSDLKDKYSEIYLALIKNENYKNFPLLVNILKGDSLIYTIEVSHKTFNISDDENIEKELWADVFSHAISEINLTKMGEISTAPHRVDGTPIGNIIESIKIQKIQLNNFRFFIDEDENNTFEPNSSGLLVYGENGSGKSSLFKAFEFLSKVANTNISKEFKNSKNIFKLEKSSSINFEFNNDEILEINDDSETNNDLVFVNNLSVFMPMLNYQKLLNISYENKISDDEKNLYIFFESILEEYPIGNNQVLRNLKELKDKRYPEVFKNILDSYLLADINLFLSEFDVNFSLKNIDFDSFYKTISLDIEYFKQPINQYHNFLNEARLSSLAMSVYFATIKKQFRLLEKDSLKILVLDDLLISLDMSNRMSLIKILENEFSDFQVFFFTHDKGLFDIFKDEMQWKSYEIYKKDSDEGYEIPYIKTSLDYFENAQKYFDKFDYPASANYLRKEVERLKKIKDKQEENIHNEKKVFKKFITILNKQDFSNMKDINSSKMIGKLKGFKEELEKDRNSPLEIDLKDIKSITQRILNPYSHDDTSKPLYKKELFEALDIVKNIRESI